MPFGLDLVTKWLQMTSNVKVQYITESSLGYIITLCNFLLPMTFTQPKMPPKPLRKLHKVSNFHLWTFIFLLILKTMLSEQIFKLFYDFSRSKARSRHRNPERQIHKRGGWEACALWQHPFESLNMTRKRKYCSALRWRVWEVWLTEAKKIPKRSWRLN